MPSRKPTVQATKALDIKAWSGSRWYWMVSVLVTRQLVQQLEFGVQAMTPEAGCT